jgi:hypothetical protein
MNNIGAHNGEVTVHHDHLIHPISFSMDSVKNAVHGVIVIVILALLFFFLLISGYLFKYFSM